MSYRALHWAWTQGGLSSTAKFVLVALADMADEAESCFPSQARLAEMCGCTERTVRVTVARLEEEGLLLRERRVRPNGSRTTDRYVLLLEGPSGPEASSGREGSYRKSTTVLPEIHDSPTGSKGGDHNPQRTPTKNTHSTSTESVDAKMELEAGFEAFWAAYPRHVGKAAARKTFVRAARDAGVEVVVEGARRFAADPNLPEKQFVPHPATWLRQGRWEDEPLPERDRPRGVVDAAVEEWTAWEGAS